LPAYLSTSSLKCSTIQRSSLSIVFPEKSQKHLTNLSYLEDNENLTKSQPDLASNVRYALCATCPLKSSKAGRRRMLYACLWIHPIPASPRLRFSKDLPPLQGEGKGGDGVKQVQIFALSPHPGVSVSVFDGGRGQG
jgi:hypothetical protein